MKQEEIETSMHILSDDDIVELYWSRDERAIDETDKKYGKYLYTIAYNILYDGSDCEECLNDTYLGTWNRIPPTRPKAFQAFLSKIMRNIAVDRFRHKNASKRIPSEMTVSLSELDECISCNSDISEEFIISETVKVLNDYLHTLSVRQEFIFVCRYYYSDSIINIAKMLGLSEATVYRELADIRKGLKEKLSQGGYGNE